MTVAYRVQYAPGPERDPARLLTGLPSEAEVITDSDPGPPPGNPWRGYQLCLTDLPACTHLCVLQDDAIVSRNFPAAVELIANANPDTPVVLFFPGLPMNTTRAFMRSWTKGQPYCDLHGQDLMPVVAVLWPRHIAESFREWALTARIPGRQPALSDDAAAGHWQRTTGTRVRVTVPSLVQHPDDRWSWIGRKPWAGKDKGRVARYWIGDNDPLAINW